MDISFTDHSHIIGKGGATIRRVMDETKCHIHFPDSNRSNKDEKSNQVSIAGELQEVERARGLVRGLTPLIFLFDLPYRSELKSEQDVGTNNYVKYIQDRYCLQVMVRQVGRGSGSTVSVKGCEKDYEKVKEGTVLLIKKLRPAPSGSATVPVSLQMHISTQHHAAVFGNNNVNLKQIMQKTGTRIYFPDSRDPGSSVPKRGNVLITGSVEGIFSARQMLVGSLPVVIKFDINDEFTVKDWFLRQLQDENGVSITIKDKTRESSQTVTMRTEERNAAGLYHARHQLLQLGGEPAMELPVTYFPPFLVFDNRGWEHGGVSSGTQEGRSYQLEIYSDQPWHSHSNLPYCTVDRGDEGSYSYLQVSGPHSSCDHPQGQTGGWEWVHTKMENGERRNQQLEPVHQYRGQRPRDIDQVYLDHFPFHFHFCCVHGSI